jgi:hypothetical protein
VSGRDPKMKRFRVFVLALAAVASSFAIVSPAQASCHEYIEGRCLENDVCSVVGRAGGAMNCIM